MVRGTHSIDDNEERDGWDDVTWFDLTVKIC